MEELTQSDIDCLLSDPFIKKHIEGFLHRAEVKEYTYNDPDSLKILSKIGSGEGVISLSGNTLLFSYKLANGGIDWDFNNKIKALGLRWNGSKWERVITHRNGFVADRAIELGVMALECGYNLVVPSDMVYIGVIMNNYEPEKTIWLDTQDDDQQTLMFYWSIRERDFYPKGISVAGAKYTKPYISIGNEHALYAYEFAIEEGLHISDSATDFIRHTRHYMDSLPIIEDVYNELLDN